MNRTPCARIEARESDLVVYLEGSDPIVIDRPPGQADVDELASAFSKVFATASLRAVRTVDVVLHEPLVQSKALADLPPLRDEDLEGVVADQQARSFRPVSEDAAVAVEWVRSAEGSVAIVATTDLRLLERLEASLSRNGRTVRQFLPIGGISTPRPTVPTARVFARDRRRPPSTAIHPSAAMAPEDHARPDMSGGEAN